MTPRRSRPASDTKKCSKAVVCLFGLLCVFRTAFGDVSENNSTYASLDFPTLFYPGPDNKFITLSPPPVLPDIISILVNGRKESFRRSKSKLKLGLHPTTPKKPLPVDVENVIARPQALISTPNFVDELMEMTSSTHRPPSMELDGKVVIDDDLVPVPQQEMDHQFVMPVDDAHGQLFQRLPVDENIRFSQFRSLQRARKRHRARVPVKFSHRNFLGQRSRHPQLSVFDQYRPSTYKPNRHESFTTFEPESASQPPRRLPPRYRPTTIRPEYYTNSQGGETGSERDFRLRTSTSFSCSHLKPGYYGDLDTGCKVFHVCDHGRKHTFECPDQTLFNQQLSVCDWSQRVTCRAAQASRFEPSSRQRQRYR